MYNIDLMGLFIIIFTSIGTYQKHTNNGEGGCPLNINHVLLFFCGRVIRKWGRLCSELSYLARKGYGHSHIGINQTIISSASLHKRTLCKYQNKIIAWSPLKKIFGDFDFVLRSEMWTSMKGPGDVSICVAGRRGNGTPKFCSFCHRKDGATDVQMGVTI